MCSSLAWKSSFTCDSCQARMLVGRCCPTPLPKCIPVPSRAENNAQTVTSHWCLGRMGSLWASSLIHRHGVIAFTARSVPSVCGVINATRSQEECERGGVGAVNGNEWIQIIRDFDKKKCWIHVKLLEWQNLFAMFLAKHSTINHSPQESSGNKNVNKKIKSDLYISLYSLIRKTLQNRI